MGEPDFRAPFFGRDGKRIVKARKAEMADNNQTTPRRGAHMAPAHAKPTGNAGSPKKKSKAPLVVLLVVLVAIAAGGGIFLFNQWQIAQRNQEQVEDTPKPEVVVEEDETPKNPIDFAALQAETPDAYAWIYIPDTNVNYAIMQSATDDDYYLRRTEQGETSLFGSIYTQMANAKDFSDPVTLIYGHTTDDGTMFDDLHKFEDQTFFNEHPDMYIYTPGHILKYQIIAAYEYDDRHILNSFDFSNEQVRVDYFNSVLNPQSMVVNVREGAALDASSKIVQLSTCLDAYTSQPYRYIVTGVLVDDTATE